MKKQTGRLLKFNTGVWIIILSLLAVGTAVVFWIIGVQGIYISFCGGNYKPTNVTHLEIVCHPMFRINNDTDEVARSRSFIWETTVWVFGHYRINVLWFLLIAFIVFKDIAKKYPPRKIKSENPGSSGLVKYETNPEFRKELWSVNMLSVFAWTMAFAALWEIIESGLKGQFPYFAEVIGDMFGDIFIGLVGKIQAFVLLLNGFPVPVSVLIQEYNFTDYFFRIVLFAGFLLVQWVGYLVDSTLVINGEYYTVHLGYFIVIYIEIIGYKLMQAHDRMVAKRTNYYPVEEVDRFWRWMIIWLIFGWISLVNLMFHTYITEIVGNSLFVMFFLAFNKFI